MRRVSIDFTYPVWDEWGKDSFIQGKTDTHTYNGPEFLTFEVNNVTSSEDYGKESGWCLWEKRDLERPSGADITRVTVDCKENPLLCEIGNDEGRDDMVLKRRQRRWEILWDAPDGYLDVEYTNEVEPRDVYNEQDITYNFDTQEFNLGIRTWAAQGSKMDLTWVDVRKLRDEILHETDAKVGQSDAPEELQQQWLDYRQRLRDLPSVMNDRGYEPWQAVMMFPVVPKDMADPPESADPNDPYRDGAFPVDVEVAAQKVAGKK